MVRCAARLTASRHVLGIAPAGSRNAKGRSVSQATRHDSPRAGGTCRQIITAAHE
jgi:hypothetical protein